MAKHEVVRHNDLIFDVGAHVGQDTVYYLKKGFRVVAVEADPELCSHLRRTFADALSHHRLAVVEAAISDRSGKGKFYKRGTSVFGTIVPDRVARDLRGRYEEIDVTFIAAADLFREHGMPYFMKVDIEGADRLCVEALRGFDQKPRYLSIEAEKDFDRFASDAELLAELGYSSFQLVRQDTVPLMGVPTPSRAGLSVAHRFKLGSAGPFGRDLPDAWISLDALLQQYRPVAQRHETYGIEGWGSSWVGRQILRAVGLYPGWHDLHARLAR